MHPLSALLMSPISLLAAKMDVQESLWPVLIGLKRQEDGSMVKGAAYAGDLDDFVAMRKFVDGTRSDSFFFLFLFFFC
jgi:hypothetical protein